MAEKRYAPTSIPALKDFDFEADENSGKLTQQVQFGNIMFVKMLTLGKIAMQKHVYVDEYCNIIDDMDITLDPYKDDEFNKKIDSLKKRYDAACAAAKKNAHPDILKQYKLNYKDEQWRLLTNLMRRCSIYPETTL